MIQRSNYVDLDDRHISLDLLDDAEQRLVARLKRRAKSHPDWIDFEGYWKQAVGDFYDRRGLPRAESRATAVYRIAQDLCERLGVESGQVRYGDYRDQLEDVARDAFPTRRAFCEATGISEDMLSHVLARRKHLAIDTLSEALARIGYALRIVPVDPPSEKSPPAKKGPSAKKAPASKKGRAAKK